MRRVFLSSGLIGAFICVPAIGQVSEPPKLALERPGLFHANIQGRFVNPAGEPIAGVHVQLNAGRIRAFPLVDVVTGEDGRFIISDVNSSYMPDLRWHPPEQWLKGGMALAAESGESIDVGTIRLQPDTVIRVAVELVGGPPPEPRDREPSIVLQGKGQYGPRIVAENIGSYRVLRQIPFDEGEWDISLFTKGRAEHFHAPFHAQRGKRDQVLTIKLLRDTVKTQNQYSAEGEMEIHEALLPLAALDREFRASGRLLAPDGNPIEGAFIGLNDFFLRRSSPQWTTSGADGHFDLKFRASVCNEPSVSYGDGDFVRIENQNIKEPCDDKWKKPRDLVIAQATRLVFKIEGADPSAVRAYWWHDSFAWQSFGSLQPWISLGGFRDMVVKVEAPGLLPLVKSIELPRLIRVDGKEQNPPAEVPVSFQFSRGTERRLSVRGGGIPLQGAIVDLEWVENLDKNSRRQVATYRTPESGEIREDGGADRIIEVFAYADGYEPQRAVWNVGTPLVLELPPKQTTLSFTRAGSAALARVRPAASPGAVRTVKIGEGGSQLRVSGGEYDVTVYSDSGTVLGYQRTRVAAGEMRTIDATLDQRPRLTIRYPNARWRSSVSDSTPRGGAVGWAAMIVGGGTLSLRDVPATLVHETSEEAVYLLSRAGRMHIELRSADPRSPILWRELDVRPGESPVIEGPREESTLKGAMSTFTPGFGNIHGIAGPRMQLIADSPSAWSLTVYLPTTEAGNSFTIAGVPPGEYHVYHHLIGQPKTYTYSGKTQTYVESIAAWGGVPLKLAPGETGQLRDFAGDSLGQLSVRVTDQGGRPIERATIRIRDRMSDSWRQFEENPAQVEQPGYPIPYPASARIMNGSAMLPNVRSGWLEYAIEMDAGPSYSFISPVTIGQELRVTVPTGVAR